MFVWSFHGSAGLTDEGSRDHDRIVDHPHVLKPLTNRLALFLQAVGSGAVGGEHGVECGRRQAKAS